MARRGGARRLADRLGELAQIPSRAVTPIAARINDELSRQFAQGSDPYGDPWAALAESTIRKKGHDLILIETGTLSERTRATPMAGAGIELISAEHGQYHQRGNARMPARKILPDRGELPIAWQQAIEEEIAIAFGKVLK